MAIDPRIPTMPVGQSTSVFQQPQADIIVFAPSAKNTVRGVRRIAWRARATVHTLLQQPLVLHMDDSVEWVGFPSVVATISVAAKCEYCHTVRM